MTPFTLCINVSIPRANAIGVAQLRRYSLHIINATMSADPFRRQSADATWQEIVTLPICSKIAPPNSAQKLTRPGAGPAAEPPRQLTSVAGGMPPASLIARRFAARL